MLFIVMMAAVTTLPPHITPSIQWPKDAPKIFLVVKNKTRHLIEVRHNDKSTEYIKPSYASIMSIFDDDVTVDREGIEWEVSELYKFIGPGSRRVSLNTSLFVSRGKLLINHPHYTSLRRSSVTTAEELHSNTKYHLVFTIQGNRFEKSIVDIAKEEDLT